MRNCVSAIIEKDGKYLIQDHVKVNAFTLPGGKCDNNEAQDITVARELEEELGIQVVNYAFIHEHRFDKIEYPAGSNQYSDFTQFYFKIRDYIGEVTNVEPTKHRQLLWLTKEEIKELTPKSVVLQEALDSGLFD